MLLRIDVGRIIIMVDHLVDDIRVLQVWRDQFHGNA